MKDFLFALEGYCDAYWKILSDDIKDTPGYIFSIVGGPASWKWKKHMILSQPTIKYEIVALATASKEMD